MRDLAYIALTITFFAMAYAYIAGCARILGRDPTHEEPFAEAEPRSQAPG